MSFTKSKWLRSLGHTLGLVLLFCCFTALQNVQAQTKVKAGDMITMPADSSLAKFALEDCGGSVTAEDAQFKDDGGNDGNYADSNVRADTVEICPEDAWHRVQVWRGYA